MNAIKATIILYIILITTSCKTTTVTVVEDDNKNFRLANYTTYDFYDTQAEGIFDSGNNASIHLIKEEIGRHMEARGLRRDEDSPDLKVNIGIQVEEKTQTRQTGLVTDPGTFTYIGQRRYTWRSETVEAGRYRQGTASLHLVDTNQDRAVWVGMVEEILPRREAMLEKTIRNGVEKTFQKIDKYN